MLQNCNNIGFVSQQPTEQCCVRRLCCSENRFARQNSLRSRFSQFVHPGHEFRYGASFHVRGAVRGLQIELFQQDDDIGSESEPEIAAREKKPVGDNVEPSGRVDVPSWPDKEENPFNHRHWNDVLEVQVSLLKQRAGRKSFSSIRCRQFSLTEQQFSEYLKALAQDKKLDFDEVKSKLNSAGLPGMQQL